MLRYAGYTAAGIAAALLLVGATLYVAGQVQVYEKHDLSPRLSDRPIDSAALARGKHLSHVMGCRHCHGPDLGGAVFTDAAPFRLTATNLTRGNGGVGTTYSINDWARAIRHGVGPEGEALIGMPSVSYHRLSTSDVNALIAYLRQAPPVNRRLPPTDVSALGYFLVGAHQIKPAKNVVTSTQHPRHVPVGQSVEYGDYLYSAACQHCHRSDLSGGPHPDPKGTSVPSLTDTDMSYPTFKRGTTRGIGANGDSLNDRWMPWSAFQHMHDAEVRALYRYVKSASDSSS